MKDKYFSYDPENNDFFTHTTEEEAKKSASEILSQYADDAKDYGWSENTGGICYGKIIASATIIKEEKPEIPPCGDRTGLHCTECFKGEDQCETENDLCGDYDSGNHPETYLDYELRPLIDEKGIYQTPAMAIKTDG